jgi:competence protein ComEA
MITKHILAAAALIGLSIAPVAIPAMAQTIKPATTPAPMTTPAPSTVPAKPATSVAAKPGVATPVAGKTNINTATAAQLDALPEIGKARTKAIMTERAKGKFADWADFDKRMTGTSVNAGVKTKIKDLVTF